MNYILFILIIVLILPISSSILTLFPNWKYYKKSYLSLKDTKFCRLSEDIIVEINYHRSYNKFCFFTNNKSIKIESDTWLHNSFITFLDPYSCYYYWKFRKFFDKIDINSLPDYK